MTHCPHCGKALTEPVVEIRFTEEELRRFWSRVIKSRECWICDCCPSHIYARMFVAGRRMLAHVVSWIIHNGQIPAGKKVCHRCDNPKCVRPDHLFLGTNSENMLDMVAKGRHKPMRGQKNANSKLVESDVLFIRKALETKSNTIEELSKQFGVTFQNVYRIALGKTWRHLGPPIIQLRPARHLTEAERLEIRRLAREGVRQVDIAQRFSVYQAEVSHVVNGTKHSAVCS